MRQVKDVKQLRGWLQTLAAEGAAWLATDSGREFTLLLKQEYVASMRGRAYRFGYCLDEDEVINTIVLHLIEQGGQKAARIAAATDPFSYLGGCLRSWAAKQWSHRAGDIAALEYQLAAPEPADSDLTPLQEVIALTVRILQPLTPETLREQLPEVVAWFAHNPPQRLSYEGLDIAAATTVFTNYTAGQVAAIARACWGSRPRQAETSIFGALLLDPEFNPALSPTHAATLTLYKHDITGEKTALEALLETLNSPQTS